MPAEKLKADLLLKAKPTPQVKYQQPIPTSTLAGLSIIALAPDYIRFCP